MRGLGDLAKSLVGNHADRAGRAPHDGMVHYLYQKAVEVHEVTRHVKGRDLAFPIAQDVVARSKARDEEDTLGGAVTFSDQFLSLSYRSLPDDGSLKNFSFRV
jgi:hypothetical protein